MPVIRSLQAASPLILIEKERWVFLLPLWLGELLGRPLGWWTQALAACSKLFPKGVHSSFSHGGHLSLSLSESQRESGYEVFPRSNPPDVWWQGSCYNKCQIIQFLLRKPAAQNWSKPWNLVFYFLPRERAAAGEWQGSTGEEVGDSREGVVRGSQGSWANWVCQMVV